jgi:hypothetical protein
LFGPRNENHHDERATPFSLSSRVTPVICNLQLC